MPDTPPTPADAGVRRSGDTDDQLTLTSRRPVAGVGVQEWT